MSIENRRMSLEEERRLFGSSNETFLGNRILNKHELKKTEKELRSQDPSLDFRFESGYIVDSDSGIVFDGKNFARWYGKPDRKSVV
jgi:hypothetical protein